VKQTTYGRGARGKATRLHSLLVRSRGQCEACGSTRSLQTAHIISRRYAATRTDERNAFALCAACHMRFTDHADEWLEFVDRTIGRAEYDRLKQKALAGCKSTDSFWLAECERLQALLREVAA
jgi:5-methylcytosine-specific restriction endonuclease McrA